MPPNPAPDQPFLVENITSNLTQNHIHMHPSAPPMQNPHHMHTHPIPMQTSPIHILHHDVEASSPSTCESHDPPHAPETLPPKPTPPRPLPMQDPSPPMHSTHPMQPTPLTHSTPPMHMPTSPMHSTRIPNEPDMSQRQQTPPASGDLLNFPPLPKRPPAHEKGGSGDTVMTSAEEGDPTPRPDSTPLHFIATPHSKQTQSPASAPAPRPPTSLAERVKNSAPPTVPVAFNPSKFTPIGAKGDREGTPVVSFSKTDTECLAGRVGLAVVGKFSHSIPSSHNIDKALNNIPIKGLKFILFKHPIKHNQLHQAHTSLKIATLMKNGLSGFWLLHGMCLIAALSI